MTLSLILEKKITHIKFIKNLKETIFLFKKYIYLIKFAINIDEDGFVQDLFIIKFMLLKYKKYKFMIFLSIPLPKFDILHSQ